VPGTETGGYESEFVEYNYGMATSSLTPKQTRFVEEYSIDHNGAAAAVRAGYSPRTARQIAHELLTKPDILGAVEANERLVAKQLQITREGVLKELQGAIAIAKEKGDVHAMIAGWREVAKICGFYAPERKEISVSASAQRVIEHLETLSDAELLQIAENGTYEADDS
jgi:phage terminase small subunit